MESQEIDRKSRLAELRRKRNQSSQQISTSKQPTQVNPDHPDQPDQPDQPATRETKPIIQPPSLQLANGETVEAVSQRIQDEIFHRAQYAASSVVVNQDNDSNQTQKISYTQDLKDDIKSYYHKANIRTERAINKIISDKYQQTE